MIVICPGTNGFSSMRAVWPLANDSSRRFPSTVIVPSGNRSSISDETGPSLHTLQHHLKSFAGGPNEGRLSSNALPAWAFSSLTPLCPRYRSTYSLVSGCSRPVSMNIAVTSVVTDSARSRTTRLSFPPLNETVTGVFAIENAPFNSCSALAFFATSWGWFARTRILVHILRLLGMTGWTFANSLTFTPLLELLSAEASTFAEPHPMKSPIRMTTSSPATMPRSIDSMASGGMCLPFRCPSVLRSTICLCESMAASILAPSSRSTSSCSLRSRLYLRRATLLPSMMTSSARSSPEVLFRTTTSCTSCCTPNSLRKRYLSFLLVPSNASLTSPGGASGTSLPSSPHLPQLRPIRGTLHLSHQ